MPTFTLVAGPNGSGKSTLTTALTFERQKNVVMTFPTETSGEDTAGVLHASEAMQPADESVILDNSGSQPQPMLKLKNGHIIWRASSLLPWVQVFVLISLKSKPSSQLEGNVDAKHYLFCLRTTRHTITKFPISIAVAIQ